MQELKEKNQNKDVQNEEKKRLMKERRENQRIEAAE